MSQIADLIRQLGAAGCSIEQIAIAVEHAERERLAAEQSRKRNAAERQKRWRARHVTSRLVASRNVTGSHAVEKAKENHVVTSTNVTSHYTPPVDITPPSRREKASPSLSRSAATPLPTTWILDEQDRGYARSKGWPNDRIEAEGERFKNHALAGGRRQKDWHAAWRNWVTSPYQKPPSAVINGSVPRPGSREDRQEKTANAIAQLTDFIEARSHERQRGGAAGEAPNGLLRIVKPA